MRFTALHRDTCPSSSSTSVAGVQGKGLLKERPKTQGEG